MKNIFPLLTFRSAPGKWPDLVGAFCYRQLPDWFTSYSSTPSDLIAMHAVHYALAVTYRTPPSIADAELVIRDFYSGAIVQRRTVPAGEHTVEVNVHKLRPGSYHYGLEIGGRPVAHHNLMVQ